MTSASTAEVLRTLRDRLGGDESGDGELLEAYLAERDEAAFERLVQRHGPMVLGVCRRVLPGRELAEDAFQATFLVFVRKADSIVPRERVGNWLYGVARRTALHARRVSQSRQERPLTDPPEPASRSSSLPLADDWRPVLDEELARLPESLRELIVLCDLEGRPQRAVAEQLGLPKGTLSARLAKARRLLAQRLARRGVHPEGTVPVWQDDPAAPLPPGLMAATLTAFVGDASPTVFTLTQGVLHTMLLLQLKFTTCVGLALLVLVGSVVGLVPQSKGIQAQEIATLQPPENKEVPPKEPKKEPTVADSLRERLKKHEADLLKIRTAMLKEVEDEMKKLDDAIKAAEKVVSGPQTGREERQKAFGTLSKLRIERSGIQSLRFEVDRMVNVHTRPAPQPIPAERRLGLLTVPVPMALAAQLKLETGKGLLVERVEAKSPAQTAGLQPYDILVQLDGKSVPGEVTAFRKTLEELKADAAFEVVVFRQGKQETVKGLKVPAEAPK